MYGGMDWVASFIGGVFAVLCGSVLLNLLSGLVPGPFLTFGLASLVAYFLGGYVAGRLVRFDGRRNGAATVWWSILLGLVLALFDNLLPVDLFGQLRDFAEDSLVPGILTEGGLVVLGIIVGALLLGRLGGSLGGRLGNRYHTRIDSTT